MDRREFIAAAASVAASAPASPAFVLFRSGALLDHAVPGVGLTVSGPVREIRLYFDLGVLAEFSGVHATSSPGATIPASRPFSDPTDQRIVIVRFGRALPPGIYLVSWHAVSIYGRSTWGRFKFTVS